MPTFQSFPELSQTTPMLTAEQLARMGACGTTHDVEAGDLLFQAGQPTEALYLLDTASADVVRPQTVLHPEERIVAFGPGHFVGEFSLLTGQRAYLSGRVTAAGRVFRVDLASFRRMMAEDPVVSDVLLRGLLTRREYLRDSPAQEVLQIVGTTSSAASLALRSYAGRQMLPHRWLPADSPEAAELLGACGATGAELPVVVLLDAVIAGATPGLLSEHIGLSRDPADRTVEDVVVIGAGPAGLAAAVYAASEGLRTALVDGEAVGGQAARSSRLENVLGFPFGLRGIDLAERGQTQALKFGARIYTPCQVTSLDTGADHYTVRLSDGAAISTRSVIVATGARYRSLPLDRWQHFEGSGIYYSATELEARACAGRPVVVLGGANSAGQAALFLASRGCAVRLVLRGPHLDKDMSDYLVQRIRSDPRIDVATRTEVVGLEGGHELAAVTLRSNESGDVGESGCTGLFCFIGARPETALLPAETLDEDGFVLTDSQLGPDLPGLWDDLARDPLPFETAVPRVFAVGDVRGASMKRVAAAAGEGASAVQSVHRALAALGRPTPA